MSNGKDSQPSIAQLEERGTVNGNQFYPEVAGSNPARRMFLIILPMVRMITVSAIAEIEAGAVIFHQSANLQQYTRSNGTIHLISVFSVRKKNRIRGSQSPIQLLLPPGLCSVVCPILTTPVSTLEPSPTRIVTSLEN